MKRAIIVMGLFLAGSVSAFAQTPVPAPAPEPVVQNFAVSVNAGGYGDNKGTKPVTVAGMAVQITANFSGGYNHIWDPSDSSAPVYKLGVGNYTRELGSLCPICKRHFVFDTTKELITFQGGVGVVKYQGVSKLAGTLGGFINIPMANHISYQLLGYQRLFGVGSPTLNRNQINTGIYWTF